MPAHPFALFAPLAESVFVDLLRAFYPTWITFAAVVAGFVVARRRHRRRSAFGGGLRAHLETHRRRVPALAAGYAGVWVLAFLVWAWQATLRFGEIWFGLGHPTRGVVLAAMYEVGLALALLVIAQTLALLLLTGPRVPRLGIGGAHRVAVRFAIATVFLDGFLLAWAFSPHAWH